MEAKRGVREIFDDISLSVISFLENHTGVTKVELFERNGVSQSDLDTWESDNAPFRLPADYKSFLLMSDGLLLRWHMKFEDDALPLGCMQINPISQVKRIPVGNKEHGGEERYPRPPPDEEVLPPGTDINDPRISYSCLYSDFKAFDLDSTCHDGRVGLYYPNGRTSDPEVWYQDLSCAWHFIARTFTDYFRLMVMHLGLPHWQHAFTNIGLDPIAQQWFRFLSPERLAIDIANTTSHHRTAAAASRPVKSKATGKTKSLKDVVKHGSGSKLNLKRVSKATAKAPKPKSSSKGKGSKSSSSVLSGTGGSGTTRPGSAPFHSRGTSGSGSSGRGSSTRPATAYHKSMRS